MSNERGLPQSTIKTLTEHTAEALRRMEEKKNSPSVLVSSALSEQLQQGTQFELFALEILDFSLKDEIDGMTLPIFAINPKAQKDKFYDWIRHDGKVRMRLEAPSGRPTQHDKDLVIFVVSALMNEFNSSGIVPDAIELQTRQYLLGTDRSVGGAQYKQFGETLDRVHHLTVVVAEEDPEKGTEVITKELAYFSKTEVTVRKDNGEILAVRVHITDWLKKQLSNKNVLTLSKEYFKLSGPLERRLYEICRKYCGSQKTWKVSLPVLHNLTGSAATYKEFKRKILGIIKENNIPDYIVKPEGVGLTGMMFHVFLRKNYVNT